MAAPEESTTVPPMLEADWLAATEGGGSCARVGRVKSATARDAVRIARRAIEETWAGAQNFCVGVTSLILMAIYGGSNI
jgi:hypothetical protein